MPITIEHFKKGIALAERLVGGMYDEHGRLSARLMADICAEALAEERMRAYEDVITHCPTCDPADIRVLMIRDEWRKP